jgi:hypothetical protein
VHQHNVTKHRKSCKHQNPKAPIWPWDAARHRLTASHRPPPSSSPLFPCRFPSLQLPWPLSLSSSNTFPFPSRLPLSHLFVHIKIWGSEQPAGLKFELTPPQSPRLYLSLVSRSVCKVTNTKDFFSSPPASCICSKGSSSRTRRAFLELFCSVRGARCCHSGGSWWVLLVIIFVSGFQFFLLPARFPVVNLVCSWICVLGARIEFTQVFLALDISLVSFKGTSLLDSWTVPFRVGIWVLCLKTRIFLKDLAFSISLWSSVWYLGFKASDGNYGRPVERISLNTY